MVTVVAMEEILTVMMGFCDDDVDGNGGALLVVMAFAMVVTT